MCDPNHARSSRPRRRGGNNQRHGFFYSPLFPLLSPATCTDNTTLFCFFNAFCIIDRMSSAAMLRMASTDDVLHDRLLEQTLLSVSTIGVQGQFHGIFDRFCRHHLHQRASVEGNEIPTAYWGHIVGYGMKWEPGGSCH